jgi:hypothetical protein
MTFAEKKLADTQELIDKLNGMRSANIDGTTVVLEDQMKLLDYWEKKVAREQGRRRVMNPVDLSGGLV